MINWAKMSIALAAAAVLLLVGAYFYITRTASGQRILARMGKDTTATALWEVGEEALDVGNIDQAITDFEKAREQDGEDNVNVRRSAAAGQRLRGKRHGGGSHGAVRGHLYEHRANPYRRHTAT